MNSSINAASGTSRATIVATVGFMCLGLMFWIVNITLAGWFDKFYPAGIATLFLAVVLLIIAILAFIDQRTLDAVIFFGGAGLLGSLHAGLTATGAAAGTTPMHYIAWVDFVWAVYFFYVWLAGLKADLVRMLFLLGTWLWLLSGALTQWGLGHVIGLIGAYIGLATAILAVIVSASAINGHRPGGSATAGA